MRKKKCVVGLWKEFDILYEVKICESESLREIATVVAWVMMMLFGCKPESKVVIFSNLKLASA